MSWTRERCLRRWADDRTRDSGRREMKLSMAFLAPSSWYTWC